MTTVAALDQTWCERHIATVHKHPRVLLRVIRRQIDPAIGKLGVVDVRPLHIDKVLTRILDAGVLIVTNDARHYLFRKSLFAVKRRYIDTNPVSGFEISEAGGTETSRQRWLNRDELVAFVKVIQVARTNWPCGSCSPRACPRWRCCRSIGPSST